jgi:hypothetical protein
MATQKQMNLPTANGTAATCPECRMNQIEAPFDYCSMCEMLSSYFRDKLATPDQRRDQNQFNQAYEKWRSILTWAEIVQMRDTYWTKAQRAKVKAALR